MTAANADNNIELQAITWPITDMFSNKSRIFDDWYISQLTKLIHSNIPLIQYLYNQRNRSG